jgi:BatD DUF11 like domain
MKKWVTIAAIILLISPAGAQVVFKTIVPQQPVAVGESFQVQYIIEDGEKITNFSTPLFSNFRVVAGPNIYSGSVASLSGSKSLKNTVYTLEAIRPGRFMIPGSTASVNGKLVISNNVVVEVITKEEAIKRFAKEAGLNSEYFLRPGENVYEKIRKNLFLKVLVDKKSCYTGEPVLATFKLYSRLESKSDIIKNPGFYGFTVYDMVNLSDKLVTTENVNGKVFDVHTIRKVQLFPLQPGVYTIDPMEIKNRIEFSRSAVYRKTEQEIVEGVLGNEDAGTGNENAEVFETEIHTDPVTIHVKPIPANSKPVSFNGAVGSFSVLASLRDSSLAKNEEGILEIILKGEGNFIQLSAPAVQWPQGVEGFDPLITEQLDRQTSPTVGSKIFRFGFVSSNPGEYSIPPIEVSYFDPDSGSYKTTATEALHISVSNKEKVVSALVSNSPKEINRRGISKWLFACIVLLVLVCGAIIWFLSSRAAKKEKRIADAAKDPLISIDQLITPAQLLMLADEKDFYASLRHSIWEFFRTRYGLSGSEMNKESISVRMKSGKMDTGNIEELQNILEQCEAGMFTNALLPTDKAGLLQKTKNVLKEIDHSLL